jgi:pimeloyl-ACP methyl ester carboxylesterase
VSKLLFLPGYACRSSIWDPLAALLKPDFESVLLDWPNDSLSGFHRVEDFGAWLAAEPAVKDGGFSAVIGHSMGGLAALKLAQTVTVSRVILCESFLTPPKNFFQNLVWGPKSNLIEQQVSAMVAEESPRYSSRLQKELKNGRFVGWASAAKCEVSAVYGTRGSMDPVEVMDKLGWPDALFDKIRVALVDGCAHFPMLENPQAAADAIRESLTPNDSKTT